MKRTKRTGQPGADRTLPRRFRRLLDVGVVLRRARTVQVNPTAKVRRFSVPVFAREPDRDGVTNAGPNGFSKETGPKLSRYPRAE